MKLAEDGIEPIGDVGPHGLRRTFASLRVAAGDDPVYVSAQIGHEDPTFTLKGLRAGREAPRAAHREGTAGVRRAVEWARMGTNERLTMPETVVAPESVKKKPAVSSGAFVSGRYWARTSDPQLVELVLSQLS